MATLRQSSWWGRHFIIGFCAVPLLAVPVLWVLLLLLGLSLEFALGFGWDSKKLHTAATNPVTFHYLATAVHGADYVAIVLVTLLFCWLARRSAVSPTWMVTACAICSLYALFIQAVVQPHSFTLGFSWIPHWTRAALPLLLAGAIYCIERRRTQRLLGKVAD